MSSAGKLGTPRVFLLENFLRENPKQVLPLPTPTQINNWFFYVLRCSDNTFYAGVTIDISRRLNEHNATARGAKYTRTRRPVQVVFNKRFESRSEAQKAEYRFKKLTRKQKESIINASR